MAVVVLTDDKHCGGNSYLQVLVGIASLFLWPLECLHKRVFSRKCHSNKLWQMKGSTLQATSVVGFSESVQHHKASQGAIISPCLASLCKIYDT